jgi:hypothetical protein
MKASPTLVDNIADIRRMDAAGAVRRVGAEMLLALARKEISASDVDAAAKMVAAQAMHMKAEIDIHVKAQMLREKGAEIGKLPQLGQMVIGDIGA